MWWRKCFRSTCFFFDEVYVWHSESFFLNSIAVMAVMMCNAGYVAPDATTDAAV
jgi:hypothetical protein